MHNPLFFVHKLWLNKLLRRSHWSVGWEVLECYWTLCIFIFTKTYNKGVWRASKPLHSTNYGCVHTNRIRVESLSLQALSTIMRIGSRGVFLWSWCWKLFQLIARFAFVYCRIEHELDRLNCHAILLQPGKILSGGTNVAPRATHSEREAFRARHEVPSTTKDKGGNLYHVISFHVYDSN